MCGYSLNLRIDRREVHRVRVLARVRHVVGRFHIGHRVARCKCCMMHLLESHNIALLATRSASSSSAAAEGAGPTTSSSTAAANTSALPLAAADALATGALA